MSLFCLFVYVQCIFFIFVCMFCVLPLGVINDDVKGQPQSYNAICSEVTP